MIAHTSSKADRTAQAFHTGCSYNQEPLPAVHLIQPINYNKKSVSLLKSLCLGWNKRPVPFWHHLKAVRCKTHGCLIGHIRAPMSGFAPGHQHHFASGGCPPSPSTRGAAMLGAQKAQGEKAEGGVTVPRQQKESRRNRRAEHSDPEHHPVPPPCPFQPGRCSLMQQPKVIRWREAGSKQVFGQPVPPSTGGPQPLTQSRFSISSHPTLHGLALNLLSGFSFSFPFLLTFFQAPEIPVWLYKNQRIFVKSYKASVTGQKKYPLQALPCPSGCFKHRAPLQDRWC